MVEIKHPALSLASRILPGSLQEAIVSRIAEPLRSQLCDNLTDDFLEILLRVMSVAFAVSGDYRSNIQGFGGTYVFRTRDGGVGLTAVFAGGRMKVEEEPRSTYDSCVSFQDSHAIWSFLLAQDQDILNSILADAVDVDGNLNYLYKFGYLARDLTRRLHLPLS